MSPEQCHIYFSGRVQGVGFRFTARSLAAAHSIKGWVKNLFDGRVELIAQGGSKDMGAFLEALRSEFQGYIIDEEIEWQESTDHYCDFSIKLS